MHRRVLITGLGTLSAAGADHQALWDTLQSGRSTIAPIQAFDASGLQTTLAAEITDFNVRDAVPKSYRKATKVMARDTQLAVAAADLAARDANLLTAGTTQDTERTYPPERVAAHFGAGLIVADLDELTAALHQATDSEGKFSLQMWGEKGIEHLTPLWMLKYLPNMLACHVTIIHDLHGPSNTITAGQASGLLAVGEALRAIRRNDADIAFAGGAEARINPLAMLRQQFSSLASHGTDPQHLPRPLDHAASGTVLGEAAAVLILEATDQQPPRNHPAYAELLAFGSAQGVLDQIPSTQPAADPKAIQLAIQRALDHAKLKPSDIDLIVAGSPGHPILDQADADAMLQVFGDLLPAIPVITPRAILGECFAAGGPIDLAVAALALKHQTIPAITKRNNPRNNITTDCPAQTKKLQHALVFGTSTGAQSAAAILRSIDTNTGAQP
ncbi:MAG: beta-ketoacyl synthase N-terminal-like domain-containing protein [Phycisphaeraceae bacterium]